MFVLPLELVVSDDGTTTKLCSCLGERRKLSNGDAFFARSRIASVCVVHLVSQDIEGQDSAWDVICHVILQHTMD